MQYNVGIQYRKCYLECSRSYTGHNNGGVQHCGIILSTLIRYVSTTEDVQYCRGYHPLCVGRITMIHGNIMRTVGCAQDSGASLIKQWNSSFLSQILPHRHHDIDPSFVTPHCTERPHCAEHTLCMVITSQTGVNNCFLLGKMGNHAKEGGSEVVWLSSCSLTMILWSSGPKVCVR